MTWVFKLALRLAGNRSGCFGAAAAAIVLSACGADGGSGPSLTGPDDSAPVPGWLTVQVSMPHSDNGAIQLRVGGAKVDSIHAVTPYDGFGAVVDGVGRVVVTGNLAGGNLVRFKVPDVGAASRYHVTVEAAAQREDFQLRDLAGYQAVVVR